MTDGEMLIEAAGRLLTDRIDDAGMRRARGGEWLGAEWAAIVDMGLPLALVGEAAGGFGVAPADALAIVRLSGRHALPLPLAETILANHALGEVGLPLAEGPAAMLDGAGFSLAPTASGWRLTGEVPRVPWGRDITTLVVVRDGVTYRVDTGLTVVRRAVNLAQMPRDTIRIDASGTASGPAPRIAPLLSGAVIRSLQIAGALEEVLALTIAHVSERVQFGRTLSKFQSVQHDLARLGGEVAAAGAAADMAIEALAGDPAHAALAIAAARIRTGEAAGAAAGIAQQLHGAIGFTAEHRLHWFTTALWSWRDEAGGQRLWADLLGTAALAAGGAGFWHFVTEAA